MVKLSVQTARLPNILTGDKQTIGRDTFGVLNTRSFTLPPRQSNDGSSYSLAERLHVGTYYFLSLLLTSLFAFHFAVIVVEGTIRHRLLVV
jgi:hypothetical protein